MKNTILATAILIVLALPLAAQAAEPRVGGYASAFVGVTIPQEATFNTTDYFNSAFFSDHVKYDPGFSIGGTGGYDFGFIRVEGELSYKESTIKSVVDKADGFSFGNVDSTTGAFAMMANVFFDLHNDTRITPYVGGGIGFANLYQSLASGIDTRGGTTRLVPLYPSDSVTVFAYQAGAGLAYALNRNLSLDLGYRYFATAKGKLDVDPTRVVEMDFESHNVNLGIRVGF